MASRKDLFFKPTDGHGSKAVYRGDKITKSVWADITRGNYVAQKLIRSSQRMVAVDGMPEALKMDVRLYTYDAQVLLATARLYQGQNTNFRTPAGGGSPRLLSQTYAPTTSLDAITPRSNVSY